MSIRSKYEAELRLVFDKLVDMCHATEIAIEKSITALRMRDPDLAREVMREDRDIDSAEREIEQDCLKILLMERPVASDFREVSAALKMITDLGMINAVNDGALTIEKLEAMTCVCSVGLDMIAIPGDTKASTISGIIADELAIGMVKDGVQSYINRDLATARGLDKRDDRVDELFETIKKDLIALIRQNPDNADQAILFMMIAKYLERIGDHAVNIGEWVEYAVTGYHNHA